MRFDFIKDSANWVVDAGAKTGNAIGDVTVDAVKGTKKLTIKVGKGVVDVVAATGDLIGDALTSINKVTLKAFKSDKKDFNILNGKIGKIASRVFV